MANKESRLVYSTETGRIKDNQAPSHSYKGDAIVRIRRETSCRKGKGVTTLSGIDLTSPALKTLPPPLKQKSSTASSRHTSLIDIHRSHALTLQVHSA